MKPSLQFNFLLHVFHLLLPLDHTCRAVPLVWSPNVAWHHRPRGPYPHWTCRFATFRWLFGQHEESRIGGNTHGSHSYTNIINNKKHMYISYTYVHRYHCAKNLESTCIFLWSGVFVFKHFFFTFNSTQKTAETAPKNALGVPHASPLDSSNPEIELLHLVHWPGTKDLISAPLSTVAGSQFRPRENTMSRAADQGEYKGKQTDQGIGVCIFDYF